MLFITPSTSTQGADVALCLMSYSSFAIVQFLSITPKSLGTKRKRVFAGFTYTCPDLMSNFNSLQRGSTATGKHRTKYSYLKSIDFREYGVL